MTDRAESCAQCDGPRMAGGLSAYCSPCDIDLAIIRLIELGLPIRESDAPGGAFCFWCMVGGSYCGHADNFGEQVLMVEPVAKKRRGGEMRVKQTRKPRKRASEDPEPTDILDCDDDDEDGRSLWQNGSVKAVRP